MGDCCVGSIDAAFELAEQRAHGAPPLNIWVRSPSPFEFRATDGGLEIVVHAPARGAA